MLLDISEQKLQADKLLQAVGHIEHIPADSQVVQDMATGNFIVTSGSGDRVQIIQPGMGDRPKVTEYSYNKQAGTLNIKTEGGDTLVARIDSYAPQTDGQETAAETGNSSIDLPPSVAKMVKAKTARLL